MIGGYNDGDPRSEHPDLELCYFPRTISASIPGDGTEQWFRLQINDATAMVPIHRGDCYNNERNSSMMSFWVRDGTIADQLYGFRCAFIPLDYQYGGAAE